MALFEYDTWGTKVVTQFLLYRLDRIQKQVLKGNRKQLRQLSGACYFSDESNGNVATTIFQRANAVSAVN